MLELGTWNWELGISSFFERCFAALVANCQFLVSSACGWFADKLGQSRVEAVELSPALLPASPALLKMNTVCTQPSGIFSATVSTIKSAFSPLLIRRFSPLSTGPINTTTKYINN